MVGHVRFAISQPITIGCWYVSSGLLLGLVASAPSRLPLPAGQPRTFSQAYYYAALATAMYFLLACMMVVTASGVYVHRHSRAFKLSMSQRTLIFQTIAFLGYILAAGAVYSRVEGWSYLDAVYFVDVTLLTIGFGDLPPKTHLGRALLFPMAIGGILFVGLIIASIRTLVLQRGSRKVSRRTVEKGRRAAMKRMDVENGHVRLGFARKHGIGKHAASELDRREQEFNLMRRIQKEAYRKNATIALSLSAFAWGFLWFIGAACFWRAEQGPSGQDWSYFESLYFTYVSLLTIGYGDFYPQDNSAKPIFVLWSLIALPTLTVFIGAIGDAISDGVGLLTLKLAEHLPATGGARGALKKTAAKTKAGESGAAKPPGFMSDDIARDHHFESKAHADAVKGLSHDVEGEAASAVKTDTSTEHARAAGEHYRHCLLVKEMQNVLQHVDASPPRKYTFAEWTWLLKLIGEDESDSSQHRHPAAVQKDATTEDHPDHAHANVPHERGSIEPWSWLGHKSPLMSSIDEPKWILERMMASLERELKEDKAEQMDDLDGLVDGGAGQEKL
jgi:potassium channel subfamily K